MKNKNSTAEWFLNRELSWLEFNDRVLREGLAADVPLLERLKFLAIVSSNLDEFFMIRVAGLKQQAAVGVRRRDPSGLTPVQQLERISKRVHMMVQEQSHGIAKNLQELRNEGLFLLAPEEWTLEDRQFLSRHFSDEILPVLTPLALQELSPSPVLPGLQLYMGAILEAHSRTTEESPKIAAIPLPSRFKRFLILPSGRELRLVRLEDVFAAHIGQLFPGAKVLATSLFRLTRDADIDIQADEAADLLTVVEHAVLDRRRRRPVRLEIQASADFLLKKWLVECLELGNEDVYEVAGLLDPTALMEIYGVRGFDRLRYPPWSPQPPSDLLSGGDLWDIMKDRDVLLFHPYESFEPVIKLVRQAAEDPQVLAIKQTLYRTSGDSPIVHALEQAADNGKEVTVLVELRARFDETRNVNWARRLEDAGCHVIYGIAGFKTHAKALLIVRRENGHIRRYAHLSTGNYNDRTARLYSDIGFMTTDRDVTTDVGAFFNLLTGMSEAIGWRELTIAPTDLRQRFLQMIEREIEASTPDRPGLIMAKINSLNDTRICQALYQASQAGVKCLLNVRGICRLRPAVKGLSENIEVRSIVDRFLEHARIFYFRNGGHEEVYLSSADWMDRNFDKRLEILFPIKNPTHRRRLIESLELYFSDNIKARRLRSDGAYESMPRKSPPVRAQEQLYRAVFEAFQAAEPASIRFRPLTSPEGNGDRSNAP
jgi:polyphosphate kinase